MPPKRPAASSAGQPAHSSAEHLPASVSTASFRAARLFQPVESGVSAAQPDLSQVYTCHAYNTGWNYTDKGRTTQRLCEEVVRLWRVHAFDAIGLSEIFDIDYPSTQLAQIDARRRDILAAVTTQLRLVSSVA